MDQMGQQIWVGHVGHVTRWPILHCTHPVSHVIFWFKENQQRQSKQRRADNFGNAQISLGRY